MAAASTMAAWTMKLCSGMAALSAARDNPGPLRSPRALAVAGGRLGADDDIGADGDGVGGVQGGDDALEAAVAVGIEPHVDAGRVRIDRQVSRPAGRGNAERVEHGVEVEHVLAA